MNKVNLYIVRGLPGSGKSTYVQSQVDMFFADWFEADMFFEKIDGDYSFKKELISEAHEWCYINTLKSLNYGCNVWVSNTFVKLWEMEKYLRIGEKIDREIKIHIIEVKTQFDSVHGVPEETMERMKRNWQELTPEMKTKYELTTIK